MPVILSLQGRTFIFANKEENMDFYKHIIRIGAKEIGHGREYRGCENKPVI